MKRKISLFLLMLVSVFTLICANVKVKAEATWTKVTDASTLAAGDQIVIVASDYNFALSTNQKNNNRGQAEVAKSGDNVTFGDDVQIITLEKGSVDGTFAFNVGNGYLHAASNSGNYLRTETTLTANSSWKITISSGVASIIAQGSYSRNCMQYNQSSSLFACYASASQKAICIYKIVSSSTEPEVKDYNSEVTSLFTSYHNNGTYLKTSTLNVTLGVNDDVKTYFHASANVRYRQTAYTPNKLSMVTSTDGITYDKNTLSVYENVTGGVKHSGNGNPYTILNNPEWADIDTKFVTLTDFMEYNYSEGEEWEYDAGVYTYNLVPTTAVEEHKMTRLAREFVAPMWLAPTPSTYAYVIFTKLTVAEDGDKLEIKLYVDNANRGKVDNDELIFSEIVISPDTSSFDDIISNSSKYSYTFSSKTYDSDGTLELGDISWTLSSDKGYYGYDSTRGQQFGSGNKPNTSMTLTSTSISGITKISINTSGASSINCSLTVKVGDTIVGTIQLTATATDYIFDVSNLSGCVQFSYSQQSSKAIYIKSINIEYSK